MTNYLKKIKINLRNWVLKNAGTSYAKSWLSFFSFIEASFFPIPPDILLIAIIVSRQTRRWVYLSFLTGLWSVFGGIFGYVIGFWLFDSVGQFIISTYNLEEYMLTVSGYFSDNAFLAIFIAGFTPIPYKVFTISAGFFHVNFLVFVFASIISRFLRFFLVGYIIKVFGKEIGMFAFKYFNILTLIFALGIIILIVALNVF